MKTKISTLFVIAGLLFFNVATAQQCSNVTDRCSPVGNLQSAGFEHPDSTDCITQGEAYDQGIQILMFSQFGFGPTSVDVDSVEFATISNLPCGLCWSTSKATNRFSANERGCIRIAGTTDDSAGQYKLVLTLKAWFNHGQVPTPVNALLVDASGIKMYLRVQETAGTCVGVDTASAAPTKTARCATAINDIRNDITGMSIVPNPLNSNAAVSFTAITPGMYTLSVTDIAGKVVQVNQLQASVGTNKTSLNRQQLQAGMYFLSISNGTSSITRKFSVVD